MKKWGGDYVSRTKRKTLKNAKLLWCSVRFKYNAVVGIEVEVYNFAVFCSKIDQNKKATYCPITPGCTLDCLNCFVNNE